MVRPFTDITDKDFFFLFFLRARHKQAGDRKIRGCRQPGRKQKIAPAVLMVVKKKGSNKTKPRKMHINFVYEIIISNRSVHINA